MGIGRRLKVLVIDDDPLVLEVVRQRLASDGHTVVVREDSLGTNRAVREEDPDVVLLDITMPAINGERIIELLQRDRSIAHTPVIVHSSMSTEQVEELLGDTKTVGIITKTSSDAEFMGKFDLLMSRH